MPVVWNAATSLTSSRCRNGVRSRPLVKLTRITGGADFGFPSGLVTSFTLTVQ